MQNELHRLPIQIPPRRGQKMFVESWLIMRTDFTDTHSSFFCLWFLEKHLLRLWKGGGYETSIFQTHHDLHAGYRPASCRTAIVGRYAGQIRSASLSHSDKISDTSHIDSTTQYSRSGDKEPQIPA